MEDHQQPQPAYPPDQTGFEYLPPAEPPKWHADLREAFDTMLMALFMFLVINTLTARVRVDGPSMEPSFYNNNRVVVSRLAYFFGDIQRGDVVVFPAPPEPDEDYIKRVIGLPGDTIRIKNGVVYVNGQAINEPYISAPPAHNTPKTVVPEGMVFVMGDNRNISSDSRAWGPLPADEIIGKAVFVYWPFNKVGVVEHYDLNGGN